MQCLNEGFHARASCWQHGATFGVWRRPAERPNDHLTHYYCLQHPCSQATTAPSSPLDLQLLDAPFIIIKQGKMLLLANTLPPVTFPATACRHPAGCLPAGRPLAGLLCGQGGWRWAARPVVRAQRHNQFHASCRQCASCQRQPGQSGGSCTAAGRAGGGSSGSKAGT